MGQIWPSKHSEPEIDTNQTNNHEPEQGSWTQLQEAVTLPYERLKEVYHRSFDAPAPIISVQSTESQTQTLDSSFLEHELSLRFFQNNRILIILRSSCVETRQKIISSIAQSCPTHQNMALITTEDVGQMKKADKQCRNEARKAFKAGQSPVVIDQGHLKPWGVVAFYKSAQFWDYHVIVWEDGLQRFTPAYFGYFIGLDDSKRLWELTQNLLTQCRQSNFDSFPDLTNLNRDRFAAASRNIMHCTMKFCGKMQGSAYTNRQNVIDNIGKVDDLEIVGFVLTSKSVGAKVRLSSKQIALYEDDGVDVENQCLNVDENGAESCHVSIGTTGDHRPKVVRDDVKSAAKVEREHFRTSQPLPKFDIEMGVLKRCAPDLWVVSLNRSLRYPALFTGSV